MLKMIVRDWSKEQSITLEQYMYVRNGADKNGNAIIALSDKEHTIFSVPKVSGWRKKVKGVLFSIEKAKSAAKAGMGMRDASSLMKHRLRTAFFIGDYDKKFIYLISNGAGMTKIGMSIDPLKRMQSLSTSCGHKLTMEAFWKVKDSASGVEARLHKEFNYARLEGEWFQEEQICPNEIEKLMGCAFERIY